MKPHWRWFLGGLAAALAIVVLALLFAAYQRPELLIDWANLNYCS